MDFDWMLIFTDALLLLTLCSSITAVHEESESNICSVNESGEVEVGLDFQRIVSTCFGDVFHQSVPNINVCDGEGRLHCDAIKRVVSIIPSCQYCDNTAAITENCYVKQKAYTSCSVNNLLSKIYCVKSRGRGGKCERKIFHDSSDSFHDVTTLDQTTVEIPEERTVVTEYKEADHSRTSGYKRCEKNKCEPCECTQSDKQTGISVGVTVGLLFVGVVIGTIVTAVICICVPSLQRRKRSLHGNMEEKSHNSRFPNNIGQDQNGADAAVTDTTLPVETTISYPVIPTAPVSSGGSNQARYHTLNTMSDNRDSHTYAGLNPDSPEYIEPMGGGGRYQSPGGQPMKSPNTVVSPVYNEFTDNIIAGTGGDTSKHNRNGGNENSTAQNEPIRSPDTNDATSHTYFVLEAQNEANNLQPTDTEGPLSDHHYFVLQDQSGKTASSEIKDKTDPNYHEYFELEN